MNEHKELAEEVRAIGEDLLKSSRLDGMGQCLPHTKSAFEQTGDSLLKIADRIESLMEEVRRERDGLWCVALCNTLDTHDIESATRMFNNLRPEWSSHEAMCKWRDKVIAAPVESESVTIRCAGCGMELELAMQRGSSDADES